MAINTWNGSSSTDWNTAANWTTTGETDRVPTSADDVIIPDTTGGSINNCELSATGGNPKNVHSLKLETDGTLIGNDIEIRVYGEADGTGGTTNGYAVDLDGIVTGDFNLRIQTDDTTNLDIIPSSGNVKNLTIALGDAARIAKIQTGGPTLTGNLTITSGQLSTENNALTVTGACTLNGGTFTGNASTVSHGSLTISSGTYNASSGTTTLNGTVDVGMRVDGTFNNNDGTFVIDGSITKVQMGSIGGAPTGFSVNNAPFHHLTINDSINFAWAAGTLFNVEGDLIVAAGQTLGANNENSGIKVLGDATLNGTLGNSNLTNDCEFGSLTIANGGTYSATSGTTTITSKTSDNYGIKGGGTFTHNNGEVKVTGNAFRFPIGATYYDFTWDTSSEPCYFYSTTLSGGATIDGTQNAGYTAILGTLKINDRGVVPYNATKVFINNLIIGDNTDSANSTNFDMQDSDVFDGDVIVNSILINADGQLKFGDAHAGNSDALEVRGAFRSLGGASAVVVAT